MTSLQEAFIADAIQEFRNELRLIVPLGKVSQFYDESIVRELAETGKGFFLKKLRDDISEHGLNDISRLQKKLSRELQKVIDEVVTKDEDHRSQAQAFIQKQMDFVCGNFKTSLEDKLAQNPRMDPKSIEDLVENEKSLASTILEHYRSHGIKNFYRQQKRLLHEKIDAVGREMIEAQKRLREREEAERMLEEVKEHVQEMSRQIECHLDSLHYGDDSKTPLKEMIQAVYDYLMGINDVYAKHPQLLQILEEAIKNLGEEEESISLEEAVKWAGSLNRKLQLYFTGNEEQPQNDNVHQSPDESLDEGLLEIGNEFEMRCAEAAMSAVMHQGKSLESATLPEESRNEEVLDTGNEAEMPSADRLCVVTVIHQDGSLESEIQPDESHHQQEMQKARNEGMPSPDSASVSAVMLRDKILAVHLKECHNLEMQETGNEVEMPSAESVSMSAVTHPDKSLDAEIQLEEVSSSVMSVVSTSTSTPPESDLNYDGDEEVSETEARKTPNLDMDKTIKFEWENDVVLKVGVKQPHQSDPDVVIPPAPKRMRQEIVIVKEELLNEDENAFNIPDDYGDFTLLRAVRDGRRVEYVREILDNGANVNIKGLDHLEHNAAHAVINSLLNKRQTPAEALTILNLLVAKGFNCINGESRQGCTALLNAMQYEDLNEDILQWFYVNGADFNSAENTTGNSVLLQAIGLLQSPEIIQKIIDFGGDPQYVNKWKSNALHLSARYAHESALEIFLDKYKLDVNAVNKRGNTPLHLLFSKEDTDYEDCLKMLLRKDADFSVKSSKGHVPLVAWMRNGQGDIFSTLMKLKDTLPITKEIASAALTSIVQDIERKQELLSSSSRLPQNEFVQFILFLIEEKNAKLLWKDGYRWKRHDWGKLDLAIFTLNFFRELKIKTDGAVKHRGELVRVTSKRLGELEFRWNSSVDSVPIEKILACMLACKNYQGFVEVCRFVKEFCAEAEPVPSKG